LKLCIRIENSTTFKKTTEGLAFVPKAKTALRDLNSFASSFVLKGSFNGDGAVVSYLVRTKEITMKLTIIALASAITLSSTAAIAHTVRHDSHVRSSPIYRDAAPQAALHPNYGNPNGNPDGPTTLSGTGNSQFGGSSPGTSGYN
jgi:hypothetical protein